MKRILLAVTLLFVLAGCGGDGGGGGGGGSYPWGDPPGPRRHTPGLPHDPWSDFTALGAAGVLIVVMVRQVRSSTR